MMIIKFPRPEDRPGQKRTQDVESRLFVGAFGFTCSCGNVSEVEPKNLIFKMMEFYCTKCGTHHRITNPAFTQPKPTGRR